MNNITQVPLGNILTKPKPSNNGGGTFIIWLAGFMDGEGSISVCRATIHRAKREINPIHTVAVDIYNTNYEILKRIKDEFGIGKVQTYSAKNRLTGGKPVYHWRATRRQALPLLQMVYPYLILKKEQAYLAIKLQQHIMCYGKNKPWGYSIDPKELAFRDEVYFKMKTLNKKGKVIEKHAEEE